MDLMEATIERIGELRYKVSSLTYEMLKKKIRIPELEEMRGELDQKLQQLKDNGIEYILVNKKEIEELRKKFTSLTTLERNKVWSEENEIIKKLNSILHWNFEKRKEIAKLTVAFSQLIDSKEDIKEVLEGYADFAIVDCGGKKEVVDEFVAAARSLGFFCGMYENKLGVAKRHLFYGRSIPIKENHRVFFPRLELLAERNEKEFSATDLWIEKMVEERMEEIIKNPKMKRWVLGTFKDEEERRKYGKAQRILAALIALKKRTLQEIKNGIKISINGERTQLLLPTEKMMGSNNFFQLQENEIKLQKLQERKEQERKINYQLFFEKKKADAKGTFLFLL